MTGKQRDLVLKARRSLDAARKLLADDEFPDFSVSRSYYAMFYCAETLLLEKDMSFSSHSAVVSAFGREFSKTQILPPQLHRSLKDAEDMRNDGDYSAPSGITADFARQQILNAEEFVTETETYLARQT